MVFLRENGALNLYYRSIGNVSDRLNTSLFLFCSEQMLCEDVPSYHTRVFLQITDIFNLHVLYFCIYINVKRACVSQFIAHIPCINQRHLMGHRFNTYAVLECLSHSSNNFKAWIQAPSALWTKRAKCVTF